MQVEAPDPRLVLRSIRRPIDSPVHGGQREIVLTYEGLLDIAYRSWVKVLGTIFLFLASFASAQQAPPLPIGLDAYRQWDRWPLLRTGMRTYMRSTYDRRGGNEGADASHFLYQLADDNSVSLDIEAPGILTFVRTNHWHGSPWRYTVDGRERLISESSTADPDHPVENSTFLPPGILSEPLAYTWSTTRGADLNWMPIPFERSFRLGYSRTHYGTGYYIWQQFVQGTQLSRPIKSWQGEPAPDDVVALLRSAGTDLVPKAGSPEGKRAAIFEAAGRSDFPHESSALLTEVRRKDCSIRAIEFDAPMEEALLLDRARLLITWDDRGEQSVDAPIALFFGAGTLYNRDNREYLVKAFPVSVRYTGGRVHLACYFPMPFRSAARIAVFNPTDKPLKDLHWRVRLAPSGADADRRAYFHATHRDHSYPTRGEDLVLLDTLGIEGCDVWSGHLAGTSFIFSHNANLGTLEGDPRFFFDDSQTPQAQGTGTEEWGGGGDYWGGLNMTLPLAGHPVGARNAKEARSEEDKIESAYRFLLADVMPFGRRALIRLEHGGTNESVEHYEAVTYWYGLPQETLALTDSLHVGDMSAEARHSYQAIAASDAYEITSRYEWGVDTLDGKQMYPAHSDIGRAVKGESTFTLSIDPLNVGVMLRRKLDYAYPNQRAEVYVGQTIGNPGWRRAGVWYLAGSNTCIYSNPPQELGAAQHIAQTSNRRFRDDEFLLPLALTRGRQSIRVRIVFTPVNRPLFPGQPIPELAWSEIRYSAYCFLPPSVSRPVSAWGSSTTDARTRR